MRLLRTRLIWRSINTSVSFSIPTLAAVVSLVTYAGTGHELESATIFSALSFFLLLRTPLQILPIALSAIADAKAALERLNLFMEAPLREPDRPIDANLKDMVRVRDATFKHHDNEDTFVRTLSGEPRPSGCTTNDGCFASLAHGCVACSTWPATTLK